MTTTVKPGERVYAVLSTDEREVRVLGFGTYLGDYTPPGAPWPDRTMVAHEILKADAEPIDMGPWYDDQVAAGTMTREQADEEQAQGEKRWRAELHRPLSARVDEMVRQLRLSPKIRLDGGEVVWGSQCWWGPEDEWPTFTRGRLVIGVYPDEIAGLRLVRAAS